MRVCVFCGASPQVPERFLDLAHEAGILLASATEHVVFGGGAQGMMGALANGVTQASGNIIGVLPRFLFDREPPHPKVPDMRVVDTMHERKAVMYDLADVFMVLPGGFGTMDETMEAITWRQLSLHDKPVVFVDGEDFWQGVELTFNAMHQSGFLSDRDRKLVSFFNSTKEAVRSLVE
jgi:uncharacterized protein (TIGR00730 family)